METLNVRESNPNQDVQFSDERNSYLFHIFTFGGFTLMDIEMNGEYIIYGLKVSPNVNLIPRWKTNGGNFQFKCINGEYPYYKEFNKSQTLVYYTDAELAEMAITGAENQ